MIASVQPHNTNALVLGTGEFSFAPAATSVATARAIGFIDFNNISATGFKPKAEKIDHYGSYRGIIRRDKIWVVKGEIAYSLKCDEWNRNNLSLAFMGTNAGTDITQTAIAAASADVLGFTATPAVAQRWYDILSGGVALSELTAVLAKPAAAISSGVTASSTTDFFSKTTHGLTNGTKVLVGGTPPAPLLATVGYWVVNKTADTFQLASVSGGTPIDLTTTGTSPTITADQLIENTDYWVDLKTARIRFNTSQSTDLTPTVCAPSIVAGGTANLLSLTPLTEVSKKGYGRLLLFDDTHPNKLVMKHDLFSCQIMLESMNDTDGKNSSETTLSVLVTDDVGTLYIAQ